MPSKGFRCFAYIGAPGCTIEFSVPGQTLVKSQQKVFSADWLELDKKFIPGFFNFSGNFRIKVTHNGNDVATKFVTVNTLTGNVERGDMKDMIDQDSILWNHLVVSYLFYDSGIAPAAGLPRQNQCYVTITPNHSNWMTSTALPGSPWASKPFTSFVLPSAHDVGMNSMQQADAIAQRAGTLFLSILKQDFGVFREVADKIVDSVLTALVPSIISSLSITQKDSLDTMLACGARYFEFRPAYLHNSIRPANIIPDVLYFMHGPIPGMPYDEFLRNCVAFLLRNPGEIIVFQVRWDGVPEQCSRPTDAELNKCMNDALAPAFGGLKVGNRHDMLNSSIDELRTSMKRLIFLKDVDSYSTYDDTANATLTGESIIAAFEKLSPESQQGRTFTNLQCQATATNIPKVVAYSALTANVSDSCLLATKALCDSKTMPWIQANALQRLTGDGLIVIMDDFLDGGMCDMARELTTQRLSR